MKKTFVGTAVAAAALAAQAQTPAPPVPATNATTNTIYGVLDLGLTFVDDIGGEHVVQGTSVGVQGSRLGFRGNVAIDPELSAVYVLEAGFNPENGTLGQGGRIFGRQVFGGLKHERYGQLTFGRQYDSLVDYVQPVTANGTVGGAYFAHPYDNDNTNNTLRFNNVLKYRSPAFGPFGLSVSRGFSNQPGGTNNNSMTSVGAGYFDGKLKVGAGYLQVNNGGLAAAGANPAGTATTDQIFASSRRQKVFGLGASYLLGAFKVGGAVTRADYQGVNESTTAGVSYKLDNYELNLSYYFSPKLTLSGAYVHTRGDVTGRGAAFASPRWDQISLLADYQIYKGLYLYGELIRMKAGGSPFAVAANGGPAAKINLVGASSTDRQNLARVGFRYNF